MVIDIVNVVIVIGGFVGGEEPLGLHTYFFVCCGYFFVHFRGCSTGLRKMILEDEVCTAVSFLCYSIHGLPAGIGIQQAYNANGDGYHADSQQHDDQEHPQLLILLGYFVG